MSTTIAARLDEPLYPEFVASLRKTQAAAAKADAAPTGRYPANIPMDYEGSIEAAHWDFKHSIGIVDLSAREVWMRPRFWSDIGWAPTRERR